MASSNLYLRAGQTPATNLKLRSDTEKIPSSGIVVGQAIETEVALSLSVSKIRLISIASQSDSCFVVSKSKLKNYSISQETDSGFSFGRTKASALIISNETDSSLVIGKAKPLSFAQSLEQSLAIGKNISVLLTPAIESEASLQVNKLKVKAPIQVISPEICVPLIAKKSKTILLTQEANQSLSVYLRSTFLPPAETDSSLGLGAVKHRLVSIANETNTGQSFIIKKTKLITINNETQSTINLLIKKSKQIEQSIESSQSLILSAIKNLSLSPALSLELAIKILLSELKVDITKATETEEALKIFTYRIYDEKSIGTESSLLLTTTETETKVSGFFEMDLLDINFTEVIKTEVAYEDHL